jgi:GTP-binding protein
MMHFEQAYKTILSELSHYTVDLSDRPRIVVATKVDALDDKETKKRVKKLAKLSGEDVFPIASPTRSGLEPLLHLLAERVVSERHAVEEAATEERKNRQSPSLSLARKKYLILGR